jgi:hypothetical protein
VFFAGTLLLQLDLRTVVSLTAHAAVDMLHCTLRRLLIIRVCSWHPSAATRSACICHLTDHVAAAMLHVHTQALTDNMYL